MNDPSRCDHDFRRVFPRHITQQDQTNAQEAVLFVICCGCGKSPIYFTTLAPDQRLPRVREVSGDWPDELVITDYDWDRAIGPSVQFRERG